MFLFRLFKKTLTFWTFLKILPYKHVFADVFDLYLFGILPSNPVICYEIVFLVFWHIPVLRIDWRHDVVAGLSVQILDLPLAHLGIWVF